MAAERVWTVQLGQERMAEETVVLKVFASEVFAAVARDVLQDEGVSAFVFKDDGGGIEPHRQRTNGACLVVNRTDVDRCREILQPLASI